MNKKSDWGSVIVEGACILFILVGIGLVGGMFYAILMQAYEMENIRDSAKYHLVIDGHNYFTDTYTLSNNVISFHDIIASNDVVVVSQAIAITHKK